MIFSIVYLSDKKSAGVIQFLQNNNSIGEFVLGPKTGGQFSISEKEFCDLVALYRDVIKNRVPEEGAVQEVTTDTLLKEAETRSSSFIVDSDDEITKKIIEDLEKLLEALTEELLTVLNHEASIDCDWYSELRRNYMIRKTSKPFHR